MGGTFSPPSAVAHSPSPLEMLLHPSPLLAYVVVSNHVDEEDKSSAVLASLALAITIILAGGGGGWHRRRRRIIFVGFGWLALDG